MFFINFSTLNNARYCLLITDFNILYSDYSHLTIHCGYYGFKLRCIVVLTPFLELLQRKGAPSHFFR